LTFVIQGETPNLCFAALSYSFSDFYTFVFLCFSI